MDECFASLEAVLSLCAQQGTPLQLFFRDDDVDEDETTLRQLLQLFQHWQTPLNLAVIPGRLTESGRDLLYQTVKSAPSLFELNQHGWQHLNHESTGRKCEFGPSRTFAEQLADIAQGQARMNEAFGSDWFPVFVPPWNRCNEATAQALEQLGFRGLSRIRGEPSLTGHGFCEVPVSLDLFRWREGAQLRPTAELVNELCQQLAEGVTVGVMLHHKVMDAAAFDLVENLLQVLQQFPIVQCHSFQQLLEGTD